MKAKLIAVAALIGCSLHADSTRYVTLFTTNTVVASICVVSTNELVQLYGGGGLSATVTGHCAQGNINLIDVGICSGLTEVTLLSNNGALQSATLAITAPSGVGVVSNYVPADAIVIPSSTTGNVQIILESSQDLVTWSTASPGTYGPSSATNRFFRVRATIN